MDPISNIQSSLPNKELNSVAGRAMADLGTEIDSLLAAVAQSLSPAHLGQNIDVRA